MENIFMNYLMNTFKNNPQYKQIMGMINNGKNPKDLFYELCKEKGVNPDTILSQLNNKK